MTLDSDDIYQLNQEIAGLVRAGIPLPEGLQELASSGESRELAQIAETVATQLRQGRPLSEALAAVRGYPAYYIALVLAGEATGDLLGTLDRCVREATDRQRMEKSLTEAVLYPISVLAVAILVLGWMISAVIPQIFDVYRRLGSEIEANSLILYAAAQGLPAETMMLISVALAALLIFAAFTNQGRRALFYYFGVFPGIRQMKEEYWRSQQLRLLGRLVDAGVGPNEAVDIAMPLLATRMQEKSMASFKDEIEKGKSLAEALEAAGILNAFHRRVLERAEGRGTVGVAMLGLADLHEERFERARRMLVAMLEPILLATVGVVLGYIIASIYMPLFALPKVIH